MKKLPTLLLLCVLAGAILVGALANAEPPPGSRPHFNPNCTLVGYLCEVATCKVWVVYDCPWGMIEVWEGEFFCDPDDPYFP